MLRSINFDESYNYTDCLVTLKDVASFLTQEKRQSDKNYKSYTCTNDDALLYVAENFGDAVYVDDQGTFYWSTYRVLEEQEGE